MDYYDINDPACEGYRVEYEGIFRDDAIEASASDSWVKVESEVTIGFGRVRTERKTLWGRVFIVKYESHETETEPTETEPTCD